MSPKRTVLLVVGSAALAAWISAAATSDSHQPLRQAPPAAPPDTRSQQLAADVARLHARLHPQAAPRQPGRNLFEFERPRTARAASSVHSAPPVDVATPPAPDFTLDGIAEDPGPDGPVRTAIIAGLGQLFLAKEGDAVTPRFKVVRIGADVVELLDADGGTTVRLALR
ncbi:MAG: hypothetical protein ACM3SQ_12465 [Betaproteobacteria bacterium]